ncbi:MAG: hypothetical protein M3478_15900 [Planctomycetota bacterium]|nr:hypothetical protein [Planctomycetota bacterium]
MQIRVTFGMLLPLCVLVAATGGCATIRTTDPPRTATEQFLLSGAASRAIDQLSSESLRDRRVFLDTTYLGSSQTANEYAFLVGELRAKFLLSGIRLVPKREEAQVLVELRSGGLGIDRLEFLLGIPALYLPQASSGTSSVPVATPELAIVKSTKQRGFASVAYVAYWADTGEVVAHSGPFIGRTIREDWWILGTGPRTVGNIPPAEK